MKKDDLAKEVKMKIKEWWRYLWWLRKAKQKKMVFKQNGIVITLEKISRPMPSPWAWLTINPWQTLEGSINWIISEKEINEKSSHHLAQDLRNIPRLKAFSIIGNSLRFDIKPYKTSETIIAIVAVIFEWAQLQKKTELLFV